MGSPRAINVNPIVSDNLSRRSEPSAGLELMAPAGEPEAAFAAFQYGADAIYLGLPRFSARAEAVNFTRDQLDEVVAFAHAAKPRRKVFLALNTLVTNGELGAAIDCLADAVGLGVDAAIVQDLGLAAIVRADFPELRLHASTQMAIHNAAGARMLAELGFHRVTLARELTVGEIRGIAAAVPGLEVEVFVHGALCYSYSGLCLYSSMLRGRSGNRGRCTYPCRDRFAGADGASGHPYSMKDLALPDEVAALRAAGVYSLKIEGRKKSPLYVACATALYRGLLDGMLNRETRERLEGDIRTVFSRPWTALYARSRLNREVTDRETVGHRGARIGRTIREIPAGRAAWLEFRTSRRLEVHDGIQVDVPGQERPYGFAVDVLRVAGRDGRPAKVFEAPADSQVSVGMPADHPRIPGGASVYCASSQAVKQRYRFERPRAGAYRVRRVVDVELELAPDRVTAVGRLNPMNGVEIRESVRIDGTFEVSRNPGEGGAAARKAFERLGNTGFELGAFQLIDPGGRFVSPAVLNRLRRELAGRLDERVEAAIRARAQACRTALDVAEAVPWSGGNEPAQPAWAVKTDSLETLEAFEADDWARVAEAVVDIGNEPWERLAPGLERLALRLGRERMRLALPLITREWERVELEERVAQLLGAGWRRWEAAGLSAWTFLRGARGQAGFDLTTDWTVYVTNRAAARETMRLGASGFVLSPEDGRENIGSLLAEFGSVATVIVHQDSPLFISEACVAASLGGKCASEGGGCRREDLLLTGESREPVRVVNRGCRSVTIGERAFGLGRHIPELVSAGVRRLRVDFLWRRYGPAEAVEIWRRLQSGRPFPGTHDGNWARGL